MYFGQKTHTIIRRTDSYKESQHNQRPPGCSSIYSYLESRGGLFPKTVIFGNQYYMRTLAGRQVSPEDIDLGERHINAHFNGSVPFHRKGWEYIHNRHNGRLPLLICAPPEGSVIETNNVIMTVENTDQNTEVPMDFLVNYVETALMRTWYPIGVASLSYHCREIIWKYLMKTGTPEAIWFKLHDFGSRGVSSGESAALGGAAHLVSFMGTDTEEAISFLFDHYGATFAKYPAFSVPASEHSTMTPWGRAGEMRAYANMLEKYPEGFVSVVSDSWDIFNAVSDIWGRQLRDKVLARKGTVVIRPDSGEVIPTLLSIYKRLFEAFGYETNNKGYKVLPPQVRVIQGDGITYHTLEPILAAMEAEGISADNITFGMGGGLLQKIDRDTQSMAMKCSDAIINGQHVDVYKESRGKGSKRGRLALIKTSTGYATVRIGDAEITGNVLRPIFRDGEVLCDENIYDVRHRAMPADMATVMTKAA